MGTTSGVITAQHSKEPLYCRVYILEEFNTLHAIRRDGPRSLHPVLRDLAERCQPRSGADGGEVAP